jgi:NAD(P)-dependent dehydrogenase (short-subunit alcohol dehydrogenase family)
MSLKNKNAVIFGAGGSIAGAVARAFAKEGAKVFLAGRTESSLKKVADEIAAAGGDAEIAIVDALDEKAINSFTEAVYNENGSIDISFNAIDTQETQGYPLADMTLDDFIRPIIVMMKTQFLTTSAVSRFMKKQGSGVILSITASCSGVAYPGVGGFGPACSALEGYSRNLASELGGYGIRVVNIRSAGSPDSKPFVEAKKNIPEEMDKVLKKMEDETMLKRLPLMAEIANVAVFLASDMASAMTGTTANVTCGTTMD